MPLAFKSWLDKEESHFLRSFDVKNNFRDLIIIFMRFQFGDQGINGHVNIKLSKDIVMESTFDFIISNGFLFPPTKW